jgi:hypothetical protein
MMPRPQRIAGADERLACEAGSAGGRHTYRKTIYQSREVIRFLRNLMTLKLAIGISSHSEPRLLSSTCFLLTYYKAFPRRCGQSGLMSVFNSNSKADDAPQKVA